MKPSAAVGGIDLQTTEVDLQAQHSHVASISSMDIAVTLLALD